MLKKERCLLQRTKQSRMRSPAVIPGGNLDRRMGHLFRIATTRSYVLHPCYQGITASSDDASLSRMNPMHELKAELTRNLTAPVIYVGCIGKGCAGKGL